MNDEKQEAILEIKNLSFSYDGIQKALDDISVSIYSGERIAVLGANGAGKSTFFLHLNGVRQGEKGEIFLNGQLINSKRKRKQLQQKVGIVFQDADSQIIGTTVKSEIAFGPMNMGLAKEDVERYTFDAVNQMHLEAYLDRPPHYLSGGEKKRVGIADILAMKPQIIVFDEPTAALDPASADALEEILGELEKEGKTILLSTHDVNFAYRFARRALVFCDGKLIADDTPENLFKDTALLAKTHLKKPFIIEMYEMLCRKGVIKADYAPKTLEELETKMKRREDIL